MGITVLHVNIQNWFANRYILQTSLSDSNPDVILLNEISINNNSPLYLQEYNSIVKTDGLYSDVAILVKNNYKYDIININNKKISVIKLYSSFGPIVIATAYSPPREEIIPTYLFHKLLNFQLPVLVMADLNAHHRIFDNISDRIGDFKGKQIAKLVEDQKFNYVGPHFKTYFSGGRSGKPDFILCNDLFNIFHNQVIRGHNIGSDHLPIIFKMS